MPEEQLGQSTDPAQLIHGDPAAISQTAQQLRTFSRAFGETAAGLSRMDAALDGPGSRCVPSQIRPAACAVAQCGHRATATAVTTYNEQVAGYNQAAQAHNDSLAAGHSPGRRPARPGPFTECQVSTRPRPEKITEPDWPTAACRLMCHGSSR